MTEKRLKRGNEIKEQLHTIDNILSWEHANCITFCNARCEFIRKELFAVVHKKKVELEAEFNEL